MNKWHECFNFIRIYIHYTFNMYESLELLHDYFSKEVMHQLREIRQPYVQSKDDTLVLVVVVVMLSMFGFLLYIKSLQLGIL